MRDGWFGDDGEGGEGESGRFLDIRYLGLCRSAVWGDDRLKHDAS